MVYVLNMKGEQLMPCENVVARLLLKEKKAKVKKTVPFIIKLLYETTDFKQPLMHKIDSGSSHIGSAVSRGNNVLYMADIEIRNDVTRKMKQRSKYRRDRRSRTTRYRKARFDNRKNSIRKDRFSPTMTSKIDSHIKEINFVRKIMPITSTLIETGTFDPHALKNPEVLKDLSLYQKGPNFGFANTKAYVLDRDAYKCQNSKCKDKHPRLNVHHVIYKSNGGSDDESNLITLCENCHKKVHNNTLTLKLKGKKKGNLKHATQMNSIRIQLLKRFPEAKETFGFITKECRQMIGLPKEHYYDAVAIGSKGKPVIFKTRDVIYKKCVNDGDYQLRKGVRSQMVIPKGKIQGFIKFDKVKYKGKIYFIKGRYSTGYAILMDIEGEKIKISPMAKFNKMKRVSARKTWLIDVKQIN
jgi:hypothetical protein